MRHVATLSLLALAAAPTALAGRHLSAQDYNPEFLPALTVSRIGDLQRSTCGAGRVLTGLVQDYGQVLHRAVAMCRPVHTGGTLGTEDNGIGWIGGASPYSVRMRIGCPFGSVVVGSAGAASAGGINLLALECRRWDVATRRWVGGATAWIGVDMLANLTLPLGTAMPSGYSNYQRCSQATQPAKGLHGRGTVLLVTALGLWCDEP